MEDTYKGESPSKKNARLLCWSSVVRASAERFMTGKHLVLVSREAGDVATLLGLAVPPKQIIAVDHNPSAAYLAQQKYPQVRVVCRDVAKIARECKRTLTSAYLDFCGTATDKTLDRTVQVILHGLKDEACLAVTLLAGREQGELRDAVIAHKEKSASDKRFEDMSDSQLLEQLCIGSYGNDYRVYLRELLQSGDRGAVKAEAARIRDAQADLYENRSAPLARMHYLRDRLLAETKLHRVSLHPLALLHYNSNTKTSNGMPMCVVVFHSRRFPHSTTQRKFKELVRRHMHEIGSTLVLDCNMTEAKLRACVLHHVDKIDEDIAAEPTAHVGLPAVDVVALLYNLPRETIIAWKAHRTRGTYAQEAR